MPQTLDDSHKLEWSTWKFQKLLRNALLSISHPHNVPETPAKLPALRKKCNEELEILLELWANVIWTISNEWKTECTTFKEMYRRSIVVWLYFLNDILEIFGIETTFLKVWNEYWQ